MALEAQLKVSGQWAPLFVEPIVGSGERLVFAIICRIDGAVSAERVIRPQILRLLYGAKARYFSEMLTAAEQAACAIAQGGRAEFPLDGFVLGSFRNARARSDREMIEQAKMVSASLASATTEESSAGDTEEDERQTTRWARRVRDQVTITASDLVPFFDREWAPEGNSIKSRVGFFNGRYAAQFGVVRRNNPEGALYHLNSRLWQLSSMQSDQFTLLRQRDLLLARPHLSSATISLATRNRVRDVIDRVSADAARNQIHVMHTENVEEASRRVFEQARAA